MSKYPANVWTVEQATAYIQRIFHHPDVRVERFSMAVVTPLGGTMKLSWDRENVGQRPTRVSSHDGPGERDSAFQETLETVLARKT